MIARVVAVFLFLAGILCLAQARPGPDSNYNISVSAGGGGFQGAGNAITPQPYAYYGMRAMTAALRGNALLNACNSTGGVDVGCADLLSDATTGKLVPATVSGITCPGANCTVKTWYDQAGTNCTATACNITNAVVANRPTLDASCVGSNPCAHFATQLLVSANNLTSAAQQYTVSIVAERIANFTTQQQLFGDAACTGALYANSTNSIAIYAQSNVESATASDSAIHVMQGVFNGASSTTKIDGNAPVTVPATPGAAAIGANLVGMGNNGGCGALQAFVLEGIIYSSGLSSSDQTALTANQRDASNGYNF